MHTYVCAPVSSTVYHKTKDHNSDWNQLLTKNIPIKALKSQSLEQWPCSASTVTGSGCVTKKRIIQRRKVFLLHFLSDRQRTQGLRLHPLNIYTKIKAYDSILNILTFPLWGCWECFPCWLCYRANSRILSLYWLLFTVRARFFTFLNLVTLLDTNICFHIYSINLDLSYCLNYIQKKCL